MTTLRVPLFDGAEIALSDPPATPAAEAALETFLALGPADRQTMTRHLTAYYRDFIEWTGNEDFMDQKPPEAIWAHVHPRSIFVDEDTRGAEEEAFVVIEADCDWEPEHGLMLCFANGRELAKCGGYDGHLTNRDAYDDDRLAEVVYKGLDPRYTTRRAP
jgi:hypothetical protein